MANRGGVNAATSTTASTSAGRPEFPYLPPPRARSIYAGWRKRGTDGAAGGIVVWISHGGGTLYTTYNHLSGVTVKIGQKVSAGQRVGSIGATGAASRFAPAF